MMTAMDTMMEGGIAHVEPPSLIPVTVALKPAEGSSFGSVAVVHAQATVVDPSKSSLFLQPSKHTQVGQGSSVNLIWTTAYVQEGQDYTFRLSVWKLIDA